MISSETRPWERLVGALVDRIPSSVITTGGLLSRQLSLSDDENSCVRDRTTFFTFVVTDGVSSVLMIHNNVRINWDQVVLLS